MATACLPLVRRERTVRSSKRHLAQMPRVANGKRGKAAGHSFIIRSDEPFFARTQGKQISTPRFHGANNGNSHDRGFAGAIGVEVISGGGGGQFNLKPSRTFSGVPPARL